MEQVITASEKVLDVRKMPGHWVLARLGKRVLRPGGRRLTARMLAALDVGPDDRVVEFAPGLGVTARLTLRRDPASYVGVERDAAAARRLAGQIAGQGRRIQQASAEDSGLPAGSATAVYGEAMLSMQPHETKRRIVREAARLLAPGGRYAIHELSVAPDDIPEDIRQDIQATLTGDIHVGVRPLTPPEWRELLEEAGLRVTFEARAPMRLLEPGRLLHDEGLFRVIRIVFNAARDREARRRALTMRRSFRRFKDHLGAVALVAIKPEQSGASNETPERVAL